MEHVGWRHGINSFRMGLVDRFSSNMQGMKMFFAPGETDGVVAIKALATVVETGRDPDSLIAVVLDSALGGT